MKFAALDFETANEKRDSACAIGLAFVEDGTVVDTYSSLLQPRELRFSPWNTRIHGITKEDVATAPTLSDVWREIEPRITQQLVVAHNASFDMSVLRHSLYANGIELRCLDYLCTYRVAKQAWPDLPSFCLGFLAPHHGISLDHHDAESDAKAAAELLLLAGREYESTCPLRLAEALGVSIGHIFSDGSWCPSSALRSSRQVSDVKIELPADFDASKHPLHEKQVVFTGTLAAFSRSTAHELVCSFGGIPKSNVSRRTDVLVIGAQDLRYLAGASESTKLRKARELRKDGYDIEILTENDFLELVLSSLDGDTPCESENGSDPCKSSNAASPFTLTKTQREPSDSKN